MKTERDVYSWLPPARIRLSAFLERGVNEALNGFGLLEREKLNIAYQKEEECAPDQASSILISRLDRISTCINGFIDVKNGD